MDTQIKRTAHTFLFVSVLLFSVFITKPGREVAHTSEELSGTERNKPSIYAASLSPLTAPVIKSTFARNWNVLDPAPSAKAVIVQSLDDSFPFYHLNTYRVWPAASLTKLLTAMVVTEGVVRDAKIQITARASKVKGSTSGLKEGEIYERDDLLKIMLIGSSNEAATALEDHVGKDVMVGLINKKAAEIGMQRSIFHDASGLSDLNQVTANDTLLLLRYVQKKHPDFLQWTRNPSILVQPLNKTESKTITNVNPLVSDPNFLGGKTGTSKEALQNLVAVVSHNSKRLAVVILGSWNRTKETEELLRWIDTAYAYPPNQ